MHITIHAIGRNMPAWVKQACDSYQRRLPREFNFSVREYSQSRDNSSRGSNRGAKSRDKGASKTGSATSASQTAKSPEADSPAMLAEGKSLLDGIDNRDFVVVLDVRGKSLTTPQLSQHMQRWQLDGRNVSLLVGGPDGLSEAVKKRADFRWSLSELTLPHPLVRVVLLEQIYRAHTILINHPYHRE